MTDAKPKCKQRVYPLGGGFTGSQCSRSATVDGKWCKTHDPVGRGEKQAEKDKAWSAKWDAESRERRRHAAAIRYFPDLVAAIERADMAGARGVVADAYRAGWDK